MTIEKRFIKWLHDTYTSTYEARCFILPFDRSLLDELPGEMSPYVDFIFQLEQRLRATGGLHGKLKEVFLLCEK